MTQPVSIMKGTAVLTAAGLLVKVFGAIYRMFLSRLIGAEGIGLYQMAYPVYLIFLSLSTAGIPIAVSRIVAEKLALGDGRGARRVFQVALGLMMLLGVLGALGMAGSARFLAGHVVADPRAVFAIWALSPAILLMSIMAALRGYFQGCLDMRPSAVSQIFEQLVRVTVALILARLLLKEGIEHAAAGAAFGATAGGAAGLIYLCVVYFQHPGRRLSRRGGRGPLTAGRELVKLLQFSLPITLTVILMPLLQTLDTLLVPKRLQGIGYTIKQTTAMLGVLGNSWAVIALPLIATGALAANLVPSIAALTRSARREAVIGKVGEGLRLALIYLIPAVVGLMVFGKTIYQLIYGQAGITLLSWFAPAIFFLGMEQVTAGILQGLGRPQRPLIAFATGALVKVTVTVISTGWPGFNLAGAALGTILGAAVTTGINGVWIRELVPFTLWRSWTPWIAGSVMGLICFYLKRMLPFPAGPVFILAGGCGVVSYFGALWLLGGINRRDLELFQKALRKRDGR